MNIPHIIGNGAEWFQALGTDRSKGTKVFSVSGDAAAPGVYELEMGSLLSELARDLAAARDVKAVLVGGAAGRMLPADRLDTPLSFETVLGSGGVTVLNSTRDIIDIVRRCIAFLAEESCGKCAPCRDGTAVFLDIYSRFMEGDVRGDDVDILRRLSEAMQATSLCGLGQTAPVPVLDSLRFFAADYRNRLEQSRMLKRMARQ